MKRIAVTPELVVDANNHLGETPIWSGAERALYWVNCENPPEIHRWYPETDAHDVWPMPERVGGMALKQGGGAVIVLASGIFDFDCASGARSLRAASHMTQAALHESAVDRQGRMWVGGIEHRIGPDNLHPGGAALFRLDRNRLVQMDAGISCSNSLAFSPDGRILYHSDAPTGIVSAWSMDPATGAISDRRPFCQVAGENGFIDGATVDSEGGYWLALVFSGRLRRYFPNGDLDLEIDLPVVSPTKMTFGGDDLGTMYITTSRITRGAPPSPQDGGVFAFRPGYFGLPEPELTT